MKISGREGDAMEKGVPIRSICRAISVMQAINRHGSLSLMAIAKEAEVPYPTACRIVQTLLFEGLIEREPARKRYRPTALVHTLSHGFQDDNRLVLAARGPIVELTKKIGWPISICTRVGSRMMVRDSTHALTSLTLSNYYPGYTLPILECAAGQAYLAYASEEERATVLAGLRSLAEEQQVGLEMLSLFETGFMVEEVNRLGYATKGRNRYTENPGKTSSIAVPIFEGGELAGSLSLIFFASAMKIEEAARRYLDDLSQAAREIGANVAAKEARVAA
jgi:IclR family mhp operon transcriptional activator